MNNIVWLYFELQGSLFKYTKKIHNNIYKLQLKIKIRDQQAFIRKIKNPESCLIHKTISLNQGCLRISRVSLWRNAGGTCSPGWKTLC